MAAISSASVDAIFAKLMLAYGTAKFNAMFRDQPPEAVKSYWAHELRGLTEADLAYAMEHLPANEMPNVMQVRAAALRRPPEAFRSLTEPNVPPEVKERVLARLNDLATTLMAQRDPKAWAWKLRQRELDGEKLTSYQRRCWREALQRELAQAGHEEGKA